MPFHFTYAFEAIEREIQQLPLKEYPNNLYEPIRYLMSLGGKRMRPMLTLLGYSLFAEDYDKVLKPAVGLEVFHNFTLMHDDIMDKAPLRRGNPTVHEKWNEPVAILSGDTMLVKAYELMMEVEDSVLRETLTLFNACAIEVCEGQQLDMDFENREEVAEEEYIKMIRLKTAVLPGFALQLGGIIAGASTAEAVLLRSVGESLGIGFQLKDDLLDVYGDKATFGKKVGGDIAANKKTFLMINARKQAQGETAKSLENWLAIHEKEREEEKIKAVTAIYDSLDIRTQTEERMNGYFDTSFNLLQKLDVAEEQKKPLIALMEKLAQRSN